MDEIDVLYCRLAIEALYQAIESLPQAERMAVVLILYHPPTRVSEILGVNRTTVYRRFRRALPLLRSELEKRGITECPC